MREVCILVTVYNGAPWIDEALDSALAQREIDFEVLVIDDGSTDETPAILARRAVEHPGRLRVVTTPNRGLSAARNLGFDHAEAEFVTCLDADDRMHPLRARLECDALKAFPGATLSFAGRWNFRDGEDEGWLSFTPEGFAGPGRPLFTEHADALSVMLENGEYPGTDACTCRTEWARTEARFDPDFRVFVDGERWIRCMPSNPVVYVACPLYERRVHGGAMSADMARTSSALFCVVDRVRSSPSSYTERQLENLYDFEKRAGIWLARRAGLLGMRKAGLGFLWAHRRRLVSRLWLRTILFLLTPSRLLRHRDQRKRKAVERERSVVPRRAVAHEDPTGFWSVRRESSASAESR